MYKVQVEDHLFKMKKKIASLGEYTIPFEYNGIEKDVLIIVKPLAAAAVADKKEVVVADGDEEVVSE